MTPVDAEAIGGAAAGASQAGGAEGREELGVAGVLAHQVGDREVHGASSPAERDLPAHGTAAGEGRQGAGHQPGLMSH